MKKEIELKWLINLLSSPYKKRLLGKTRSACKSELEGCAKAPLNSKEFHIFLNKLISSGAVEFYSQERKIDTFVINEKLIKKELCKNELYISLMNALTFPDDFM